MPPKSNAYISRLPEALLSQALEKVPAKLGFRFLAVKDNIVTDDFPTTCASKLLRGYKSPFNAFVLGKNKKCKLIAENGLVTYGKTNLDEFGMGSHSQNSAYKPVVHNFHKERLSAGGSSGGSALAIGIFRRYAKFQSAGGVALGTDTGGSVRLPAAYTGVLGFKPSYGILSRHGVVPYANSLDTVGILASSVKDVATFFKHAFVVDRRDPSTVSGPSRLRAFRVREQARGFQIAPVLPGKRPRDYKRLAKQDDIGHGLHSNLRIGVPIEYNIDELAPEVRQAWHDALCLFEQHGCTIVPISLPNTKHALSAYYVIAPAEASSNLAKYDGVRYGTRQRNADSKGGVLYSQTRDNFGDEVKRRILLGSYTLSSEAIDNYFIKAQKVRRLIQRDFDRVFTIPNPLKDPIQYDLSDMDESILLQDKLGPPQVDFIVCPTAPTTPPTLNSVSKQTPVDSYMNDVFTVPASLAGLPAISVPMVSTTSHDSARPIGIQIIGQYSDDNQVLAVADTLMRLKSLAEQRSVFVSKETRKTPLPSQRKNRARKFRKIPLSSVRKYLARKFESRPSTSKVRIYKSGKVMRSFISRKGGRRLQVIRRIDYIGPSDRRIPFVGDTLARWKELPSDDESKS